jgi:phasin
MLDQIARQAQEALAATTNVEVPAEIRSLAQDGVSKVREAYDTWNAATRTGGKALEEMVSVTQAASKAVSDRIVGNMLANTEVAFDVAEKIARARTLTEAIAIQTKYAQSQVAIASQQGKELFELSAKVAQETAETLTGVATRSAEALNKVA